MRWLAAPARVLAFTREPATGEAGAAGRPGTFACVVNLSDVAVPLPPHERVLLASGALVDGLLPTDTAVWLQVS